MDPSTWSNGAATSTAMPATTAAPATSVNPLSGTANNGSAGGGYGSFATPYSPSTFFNSPDYAFNMQQGTQALNRSEAAGGQGYSGAAIKDALGYASGLASQDYNTAFTNSLNAQNNEWNMLAGVVNTGQGATQSTVNAGNTAGANIGSAASGYGNGAAAGYIGAGNAASSGYNQIGNTATSLGMQYTYGQNNPNSPFYTPPTSTNAGGQGGGSGFNAPGAAGSTNGIIGSGLQFTG
jgi:hypothetical protein